MLLRITRMLNVTVMGFIALTLAFIAASVNCEEEPVTISKTMFIKPDKIILNSNSLVNDVVAQFPGVGGCPPEGTAFELTLTKNGVEKPTPLTIDTYSYHYCLDDDVLQVQFNRQGVQDLVGDDAGFYTATVTFEILPYVIEGEDDSVEMISPAKSSK
jgi:hypothetical protein